MQLKRQQKKMRAQFQYKENIYEKIVIIERIKLTKEYITHKMRENKSRRIIKEAQQIKSNIDNGGKIWEIKRKVQRRKSNTSYYQRFKKTTESNVHPRY